MIPPWVRYVDPWTMRERVILAAARGGRAWKRAGRWCCLRERENPVRVKPRWTDESAIALLIESLRRNPKTFGKKPAPSSYAWAWMQMHAPPRCSATLLRAVGKEHSLPKPWNEAVNVGSFPGRWFVYDVVSAYAWAGMKPLPDVRDTIYCDGRKLTRGAHGLYLVQASWTAPRVPPRLRTDRPVWVTREELEQYDGSNVRVLRGAEWLRSHDLRPVFDRARSILPPDAFKRMCRAFWGAWVSETPVEEYRVSRDSLSLTRNLPMRHFCPVWGWFVMARVTLRCAEIPDSIHVFTDSVITRTALPESGTIGSWKRERVLDNPWVASTGLYGDDSSVAKRMGVADGAVSDPKVYRSRAESAAKVRKHAPNEVGTARQSGKSVREPAHEASRPGCSALRNGVREDPPRSDLRAVAAR